MSAVKLPVSRAAGRALLIGVDECRIDPLEQLNRLGFQCDHTPDPYAALATLVRGPRVYAAVILDLPSLYREELKLITTVKRRWPQMEIWLTHTEGRATALADAMSLGADGIVTGDGLQRMGSDTSLRTTRSPAAADILGLVVAVSAVVRQPEAPAKPMAAVEAPYDQGGEPLLTADELSALLQHSPELSPSDAEY
jgi:hypothetical protein